MYWSIGLCGSLAWLTFFRFLTLSLHRKSRISLHDLSLQLGHLAFTPNVRTVSNAIGERTSVGTIASLERPGDADKLRLETFARDVNHGVAMTAHVDE
jgi:hypothetical protein